MLRRLSLKSRSSSRPEPHQLSHRWTQINTDEIVNAPSYRWDCHAIRGPRVSATSAVKFFFWLSATGGQAELMSELTSRGLTSRARLQSGRRISSGPDFPSDDAGCWRPERESR